MTEIDLDAIFRPYGLVLKVKLISDHFNRQSKCFGYVQMADREKGCSAMPALHGTRINGRILVAGETRPRDERFGLPWGRKLLQKKLPRNFGTSVWAGTC